MLSISSISFKAIIKYASNHRALHLSLMEKLGLSRRSYFIHVVNYSQYGNAWRGSGARTNQYQRNIAMLSRQFGPAPHAGELSSLFSLHIQQSLSGQFPPVIITLVRVTRYLLVITSWDPGTTPSLPAWPCDLGSELISIQSNKGSFSSPRPVCWHKGWKAGNLTPEEHGARDKVLTGPGSGGAD